MTETEQRQEKQELVYKTIVSAILVPPNIFYPEDYSVAAGLLSGKIRNRFPCVMQTVDMSGIYNKYYAEDISYPDEKIIQIACTLAPSVSKLQMNVRQAFEANLECFSKVKEVMDNMSDDPNFSASLSLFALGENASGLLHTRPRPYTFFYQVQVPAPFH